MSISEKQLIANRNNCLKSTGPRTSEGKNIASRNAVRHGLLSDSAEVLLKGENQDEFESFHQNLVASLDPQGQLEVLLAERITGFFWKLKRAGRMEKGLLDILSNPSSDSNSSAKKDLLPFTMITTKTYLNPSEDPEYQEFKKLKQQQAVACGFDPSENRIIAPETFRFIPGLRKNQTESSPVTDSSSAESLGHAVRQDFQNGGLLERLLRYEGQIERGLYRALTELQKFQFLRRRNEVLSVDDLSLPQGEASVHHSNYSPDDSRDTSQNQIERSEIPAHIGVERSEIPAPACPELASGVRRDEPISADNVAEASRFGDSLRHPCDLSAILSVVVLTKSEALATAEGGDPDSSLGSSLSSMGSKPNEAILT